MAIFFALVLLGPLVIDNEGRHLWYLIPSVAPVFAAGLAEDLGYNVSPRNRLIAAGISSLVAIMLFGMWIPRADIPLLSLFFAFAPLAIAVTVLGGAGICNAFNLVDGVNGLSGSIAVVAAGALAAIAAQNGLHNVVAWCAVMIGALLGFLIFNFPFGKIFMGDAGAYSVGHVLAWIAFLLLNYIPTLTPWALVLIFFWPIADTMLAIFRRRLAGRPADQPDRLHFHQLVMRALEIAVLGRNSRHISNPLTTVILAPMFIAPAIAGVMFWNNPAGAGLSLVFFSAVFVAAYRFGASVVGYLRQPVGRRTGQGWGSTRKRLSQRKH
ncbi:MraY family glycosyltransferase [Martelella limonii]|uniref:MraY family glycosyltransferase n=1 Tax=Martelella limonii TaxID=1647649 RepID=UPI0031403B59